MSNNTIVFAGRNTLGVRCLDALMENTDRRIIVAPAPVSRDNTEMNLEEEARKRGLEIFKGDNINDRAEPPELLISVLYDKRIRKGLLEASRCVNLHLAPLPKYGGMNTFYWPIRNGEQQHGVTLHEMELDFDTGGIIEQRLFNIGSRWAARDLGDESFLQADLMFQETLPSILSGDYETTPQDLSKKSYYGSDAIDFRNPISLEGNTADVYNLIRANIFPPFPGPTVVLEGRSYEVESVAASNHQSDGIGFLEDVKDIAIVGTSDGSLALKVKEKD